jgi:hypothetical protein
MADGDITIITTIHPVKNGRRPITVAAAAEGELPTLLNGNFPDRHGLADQAYGAVLKAQAAAAAKADKKKATGKKVAKPKKSATADGQPAFGEPGHLASRDSEADQIGPDETDQVTESPVVEAPDDLPVIEGDEQAQLELEGVDG